MFDEHVEFWYESINLSIDCVCAELDRVHLFIALFDGVPEYLFVLIEYGVFISVPYKLLEILPECGVLCCEDECLASVIRFVW